MGNTEDIRLWMTQNNNHDDRGKMREMQYAINDLRDECHFNIHTIIQHILNIIMKYIIHIHLAHHTNQRIMMTLYYTMTRMITISTTCQGSRPYLQDTR